MNVHKNTVLTFVSKPLRQRMFIVRDINEELVPKLITCTKRDRKIYKLTEDRQRFKNLKTFSIWKKRNKIIYSMTNRKNKLIGIMWFRKNKKYKYVPSIRVYPPARNRGVAEKFAKQVLRDFEVNYKFSKIDKAKFLELCLNR